MNLELQNADSILLAEPVQYVFVADAELANVGGGSLVVEY